MELMAWTVNKPENIEWLIDEGFDYILTDRPEMMCKVLEKRAMR
jgi:glycerophosphoryl diester phosphodiesterase